MIELLGLQDLKHALLLANEALERPSWMHITNNCVMANAIISLIISLI